MIGPFSGEYRFLSNFWPEPARGGLSNEHFFQAEKTLDPEERAFVMRANGPGQAKRRGRQITLREDWDTIKVSVMLSGLRSKFYSDPVLARLLIGTDSEPLVELNTWGDTFWGMEEIILPSGEAALEGKNVLGTLLMQVREEFAWTRYWSSTKNDFNDLVPPE